MILSASRRTDIPAYYFDWFLDRLDKGYLHVKNPFNRKQVRFVNLEKSNIDGIVFWTKNPSNCIDRLDELLNLPYYFWFTLNNYPKEIESNLPSLNERLSSFIELSNKIGKERVLWRYDPIFLTSNIGADFHINSFERISKELKDYTDIVTVSVLEEYRHIRKKLNQISYRRIDDAQRRYLFVAIKEIARENGLKLQSCCQNLLDLGIENGPCIDSKLISKILNKQLNIRKAKYQRENCLCDDSIDIGAYGTCKTDCKYCYAKRNGTNVKFENESTSLAGKLIGDEKIIKK